MALASTPRPKREALQLNGGAVIRYNVDYLNQLRAMSAGTSCAVLRVSMRTDYGLRAAIELAARFGQPPISSADVASRQEIPEPYLDQLLVALRKAGLVRSARGPLGGHALARDPREVTAADVVAALEGRTPPSACFDERWQCQLGPSCAQREVWTDVDRLLWDFLKSVTLADLVARQSQLESRAMYYI